jgi:hypothetical protein
MEDKVNVATIELNAVVGLTLRYVLVDTNCFLRLYQSPVLPFLGRTLGGYHLVTLPFLIDEFLESNKLRNKYAWLEQTVRSEDLTKIAIVLSEPVKKEIDDIVGTHSDYVNGVIADHCAQRNIIVRQLSPEDCELLATAIVLKAVIATDEWPMDLAVTDLLSEPEDNYCIEVFSSVHVLHLLEAAELITADERKATIKSWLQNDEKLRRDWRTVYQQLFGEFPATL